MDLPAAIALVIIGAAAVFAVAVNVRAHRLVRGLVMLERSQYRAGDIVEGRLTVNALRTCTVKSVRLTLACWDTDPQNELCMSRDGWLFKSVQTIYLDRLLMAGQSQSLPFALPMPQPGEMPIYVFLGQGKTRYPAIWSVSADIECNGLIVSTGNDFEAVSDWR
jgi:hypothetical protein